MTSQCDNSSATKIPDSGNNFRILKTIMNIQIFSSFQMSEGKGAFNLNELNYEQAT